MCCSVAVDHALFLFYTDIIVCDEDMLLSLLFVNIHQPMYALYFTLSFVLGFHCESRLVAVCTSIHKVFPIWTKFGV